MTVLSSQSELGSVIPAKAGIQSGAPCEPVFWIPAFAGMTNEVCMVTSKWRHARGTRGVFNRHRKTDANE
ncbi:MAG: hypothetical protein ACOVOX_15420, partial [Burkholderiaceae bacterium]